MTSDDTHPAQETADRPADEAAATSGGLRILVAEDEALIRMDLAEMLQEGGHQVVGQAADGEQAVQLARELRPDLVVMDIKMPGIDGVTAFRRIKANNPSARVVLMTAHTEPHVVEAAVAEGALRVLSKPVDMASLLQLIE